MGLNLRRRGVVPEREFTEAVERLRPLYPSVDDCVEGISWALAKQPEMGFHIKDHTWGMELVPPQMPRSTLFYTFTDRMVFLLHLDWDAL